MKKIAVGRKTQNTFEFQKGKRNFNPKIDHGEIDSRIFMTPFGSFFKKWKKSLSILSSQKWIFSQKIERAYQSIFFFFIVFVTFSKKLKGSSQKTPYM